MANVVTDWRDYMIDALAAAFPEAEVKAGRRVGVSRDRDRIVVFAAPWLTDTPTEIARPTMLVRYWKRRPKTQTGDVDPAELEQAKVDLLVALRAIQALPGLDRPWYFIVDRAEVDEDPEEWGVECLLVGYTANVAVIA